VTSTAIPREDYDARRKGNGDVPAFGELYLAYAVATWPLLPAGPARVLGTTQIQTTIWVRDVHVETVGVTGDLSFAVQNNQMWEDRFELEADMYSFRR